MRFLSAFLLSTEVAISPTVLWPVFPQSSEVAKIDCVAIKKMNKNLIEIYFV